MIVPVCHSLTGEVLKIELADGALVEELRGCLKRLTNVEPDSQVLICEWEPEKSLEKRKAVAFYGLPREGHTIFFYDKAWFRTGSVDQSSIPVPSFPRVEPTLPTQEQSLAGSSLMAPQGGEVEPMQNALIMYAASFAHWRGTAEAYHTAATARIEVCERISEELAMQRRASVLARSSLKIYHKVVEQSLEALEKELERADGEVERVLPQFDKTVARLRETELHQAHCATARLPEGTRLMSFVKDEEALRRRVDDCKQIRVTLEGQVREGRRQYEEVSQRVGEELDDSPAEDRLMKDAEEALVAMRDNVKKTLEAKLTTFRSDFDELEGYLSK
eukprot:CAMPEP_0169468100 /NCGR_PEP_ID=MMETSP1042-20121227/22715_1 /TAXON_ID=464988 /ORGANISM="Hemiselmis andersenii, Strain CCMP1180" /LENGTH=332 /DNA_ID=CAMNT_0009581385 /DNA_START=23 /DNA_END=1018 /DNA_ORIENTATION=+